MYFIAIKNSGKISTAGEKGEGSVKHTGSPGNAYNPETSSNGSYSVSNKTWNQSFLEYHSQVTLANP